VGLADPNDSRQELLDVADQERHALRSFLREFKAYATWGAMVRDMLDDIERSPSTHAGLRGAILEWCGSRRGEMPTVRSLANRMRGAKGRVVAGMRLEQSPGGDKDCVKWVVRMSE
jgi:hypothetical protein